MQFEKSSLLFNSEPALCLVPHVVWSTRTSHRNSWFILLTLPFSVVQKPLMICEAPRFLSWTVVVLRTSSTNVKALTLSTCWVFGLVKSWPPTHTVCKAEGPGPGLVNAVVRWGGEEKRKKRRQENSGLWASVKDVIQWTCCCCPLVLFRFD